MTSTPSKETTGNNGDVTVEADATPEILGEIIAAAPKMSLRDTFRQDDDAKSMLSKRKAGAKSRSGKDYDGASKIDGQSVAASSRRGGHRKNKLMAEQAFSISGSHRSGRSKMSKGGKSEGSGYSGGSRKAQYCGDMGNLMQKGKIDVNALLTFIKKSSSFEGHSSRCDNPQNVDFSLNDVVMGKMTSEPVKTVCRQILKSALREKYKTEGMDAKTADAGSKEELEVALLDKHGSVIRLLSDVMLDTRKKTGIGLEISASMEPRIKNLEHLLTLFRQDCNGSKTDVLKRLETVEAEMKQLIDKNKETHILLRDEMDALNSRTDRAIEMMRQGTKDIAAAEARLVPLENKVKDALKAMTHDIFHSKCATMLQRVNSFFSQMLGRSDWNPSQFGMSHYAGSEDSSIILDERQEDDMSPRRDDDMSPVGELAPIEDQQLEFQARDKFRASVSRIRDFKVMMGGTKKNKGGAGLNKAYIEKIEDMENRLDHLEKLSLSTKLDHLQYQISNTEQNISSTIERLKGSFSKARVDIRDQLLVLMKKTVHSETEGKRDFMSLIVECMKRWFGIVRKKNRVSVGAIRLQELIENRRVFPRVQAWRHITGVKLRERPMLILSEKIENVTFEQEAVTEEISKMEQNIKTNFDKFNDRINETDDNLNIYNREKISDSSLKKELDLFYKRVYVDLDILTMKTSIENVNERCAQLEHLQFTTANRMEVDMLAQDFQKIQLDLGPQLETLAEEIKLRALGRDLRQKADLKMVEEALMLLSNQIDSLTVITSKDIEQLRTTLASYLELNPDIKLAAISLGLTPNEDCVTCRSRPVTAPNKPRNSPGPQAANSETEPLYGQTAQDLRGVDDKLYQADPRVKAGFFKGGRTLAHQLKIPGALSSALHKLTTQHQKKLGVEGIHVLTTQMAELDIPPRYPYNGQEKVISRKSGFGGGLVQSSRLPSTIVGFGGSGGGSLNQTPRLPAAVPWGIERRGSSGHPQSHPISWDQSMESQSFMEHVEDAI